MHSRRRGGGSLCRIRVDAFVANPALDLSVHTVEQLKQLLEQQVPKDEVLTLRKAEVLQRLNELIASRLAPSTSKFKAIKQLADNAAAAHMLSRLRTDLLLAVSLFLDLTSLVRLASCDRFLRARMTLAVTDQAATSPALAALRTLEFRASISRVFLLPLLSRTQWLERLSV